MWPFNKFLLSPNEREVHGTYIRWYMLRTHEGKLVFSDKNTRFVTALDVIKCLEQVE